MNLKDVSSHKLFSHIYVEEDALSYEMTSRVISSLPGSHVVPIRHYKDVFNRKHQDIPCQTRGGKKLILAVNRGTLIYKGASVCQDFGNSEFFYATPAMNCVFDCDYCFLKGMYDTANIVLFVNTDDYEREVKKRLEDGPLHLHISYDTDVFPLEKISGIVSFWTSLAQELDGLTIEIRTKSAPSVFTPSPKIIYAFTISPDEITERFEHRTASLDQRLRSVSLAIKSGCRVRLCFDPMIYVKGYKEIYSRMTDKVISSVDLQAVDDISIGTFRISGDYIRDLRKNAPDSAAVQFPFVKKDNVMRYPDVLEKEMKEYIRSRLKDVFDEEKIYEY